MAVARDIVIDVANVADKEALHRVLAENFRFPDYYGKNWDAFWDCLTSLESIPQSIRVVGFQKLEANIAREASFMKRCLLDFQLEPEGELTKLFWN